jgi:membrane protein implicated in regulation of membrane protease activity
MVLCMAALPRRLATLLAGLGCLLIALTAVVFATSLASLVVAPSLGAAVLLVLSLLLAVAPVWVASRLHRLPRGRERRALYTRLAVLATRYSGESLEAEGPVQLTCEGTARRVTVWRIDYGEADLPRATKPGFLLLEKYMLTPVRPHVWRLLTPYQTELDAQDQLALVRTPDSARRETARDVLVRMWFTLRSTGADLATEGELRTLVDEIDNAELVTGDG